LKRDTGTDLSIALPAQPDNVSVIREAVAERARELGLDRRAVDDLKTVVSEACANVVLHAYPEEPEERPLEVDLNRHKDGLKLTVRDKGCGIQPAHHERARGLRMGLLLIGALSSCFQLRSRRGGGTELTLLIPLAAT
jgi:anti-sigma regulatory factor (Ser/Thr protein kinase)